MFFFQESAVAKGQQKSNKETKKPKKAGETTKVISSDPVRAVISTAIFAKGKEKKKQ